MVGTLNAAFFLELLPLTKFNFAQWAQLPFARNLVVADNTVQTEKFPDQIRPVPSDVPVCGLRGEIVEIVTLPS
ncbi:hypothetical protein PoB_007612500 [Plakobranchus ocellatus]|uniref:Uncharacterized protein n=1 Tax=Plakobranchus ocellatus TaxID=259542 RepID=A0AAV4DZW9_9GAST|nr:hypothetical protein PoB_007612500 [Plakobranchus ocellatus]